MRIFTASFATETNSFSSIPTSLDSFLQRFYYPSGKHPQMPFIFSALLTVARKYANDKDLKIIEGSSFFAEPGGIVSAQAWESIKDDIGKLVEASDSVLFLPITKSVIDKTEFLGKISNIFDKPKDINTF